ncbi:MAG: ATP synthase F1 subunit epsilon [bacterium]
MSGKLCLEIVTPEKIVLREKGIDFVGVEFPDSGATSQGAIGILEGHAPLLVRLSVAPIRYKKGNDTMYVVVAGGFLEVKNNIVTILSQGAEMVTQEPDIDIALTARKRVEKWLEGYVGKVEFDEQAAELDIKKSAIKLYRSSRS